MERRGIYDDKTVDVFVNLDGDFAYLSPPPEVDYSNYQPRRSKLSLESYRRQEVVAQARFEKVKPLVKPSSSFLEIGPSEGEFLRCLRTEFPELELAAQEADQLTREQRSTIGGVAEYNSLDDIEQSGKRFDCIGFFHVLEHIVNPGPFLNQVKGLLTNDGVVIIEVPSFLDPLMGLLRGDNPGSYQDFFYQKQHPYYYSELSLTRLLEFNGFDVERVIQHQRYGLENHLAWLVNGMPGGDAEFARLFSDLDDKYKELIETRSKADAIIMVAKPRN